MTAHCCESAGKLTIIASLLQAGIFDLDGVITRTARVHAAAWKEMFDAFLESRSRGGGAEPFDISRDYGQYVDGKPRYDGVRSFLESRGIDLPFGSPDDPPDRKTVCGLGNKKNILFKDKIREQGVEIFPAAEEFIRALRARDIRTAVVSSSKNCPDILEAAGLRGLFDAEVDGNTSQDLGLKGKPEPDIFLEAAKRLGVEPGEAIVFEDAISGIRAGKKGGFGCVVGVARKDDAPALRSNGADAVITSFAQIHFPLAPRSGEAPIARLPSALERLEEIRSRLAGRRPALFLDYDGTLTPIVRRPDLAVLSEDMRRTVRTVARKIFVAVISGRDLADVKRLVGIPSLAYAGSHGFDIAAPGQEGLTNQKGEEFRPELEKASREIEARIGAVKGAHIERKKFSFAVHVREVDPAGKPAVEKAVDETVSGYPGLRKSRGKEIFEVQPDLDWDKGRALLWLLEAFGLDKHDVLPFYLGDDVTDEDAFEVLADRGVGIVVGGDDRPTAARFRLDDPDQVRRFLLGLAGTAAEAEA
ncbi:MAG TPA: trehalose-phosphatase [Candidatus Aminicenantes bacterium]|nr:trehalose-phosphatase [Candidatus Aminicenantes bacterium]